MIFDKFIMKYIISKWDVFLAKHKFSELKSLANNTKYIFFLQSLWLEDGFLVSRHPLSTELYQHLSILSDVVPSAVIVLDADQSTVCKMKYPFKAYLSSVLICISSKHFQYERLLQQQHENLS